MAGAYPRLSPYKDRGGTPISDHRIVRIVDLLNERVLYDCLDPSPPASKSKTT